MLTDGLFDGQVTAQDITIQMSRHHHGSRYHCSAVNRMVPGVPAPSQQIVLEVEYKPVIVNKEANNKAAASSREEAVLQCQSDSNPAPQVYWFHGNKRVISDGVHYTVTLETEGTITTSFLRITSVQPSRDYGTYNCTTNTTMGMDSFLIDLQGKRIPDPVNDMQVIHMTDTTVTVSWQPGFDGGEEQLFHLKYRLHGNHDDVWMQSTSTVQPPLVLRELKPSTEYEIVVVSENSLGSAESNPIVRQTLLANFGTKSPQTDKRSSIGVPIGVAIAILAALVVLIAVIVIICKRRKSKKGEKPSTVCANVEFDSRRNNQHQNDLSLSYFTRPPAPEPPLRSVSVPAENLPYNVQPTLPSQNQTKRHYPEDSKWSGRQVSKPKT
ncbi:nephrin-like [Glandiceps talaboti]